MVLQYQHSNFVETLKVAIHSAVAILKPGYGASLEKGLDGGFYFSGTTGIKFSNVTIGVGYASQCLSWDYNEYIRISGTYDGLTVKVGYEF